jgi:diguanylate cyclase (GGDEF)-like protein
MHEDGVDCQSWLCRNGSDRERMLDMDRRLAPVRRRAFIVLGVILVASGPWLGYWTIAPLLVAGVVFKLADSRIASVARPEWAMFAAWTASEVIIAASIVLTGGTTEATFAWFAIPIVTLSARFSTRGIVLGVVIALGLLLTVGFASDAGMVISNPPLLLAPAGLIIAVAILSTALMHSDVEHRSEAVIDQLTGMLNRHALDTRTSELAQQSQVSGQPIGVIVGDLDHFKQVNDTYGHPVGDAVLKDVAYRMRKLLRAFDLAYRLGGEEFLVLLPGASKQESAAIAEQLRHAVVAETTAAGQSVSMSFGVSASLPGATFDFTAVFAQADAALYEAKRSGRNRVCYAGQVSAGSRIAPKPVPVSLTA